MLRVVRGGIRFELPRQGESVDLTLGDTLTLPAGIAHNAIVDPDGMTCLEVQRPARPVEIAQYGRVPATSFRALRAPFADDGSPSGRGDVKKVLMSMPQCHSS